MRAPYAGFVVARLADEGTTALVQPQTIVLVLQESGELEAQATIPESQLALVRVGDPALIHVEGLPAPIQTEVSAVSDAIDPATRTYPVRMRVPNADRAAQGRRLRPKSRSCPQSKRDALVVPREARAHRGRPRARPDRARRRRDARAVDPRLRSPRTRSRCSHGLRVDDAGDRRRRGRRTIAPGMRVRVVAARPRGRSRRPGRTPEARRHLDPPPRLRGDAHRRPGACSALVSIPRLGVDLFPRVEFPIVTVTTVLEGAAPETVEREVSQVLEESINTIEGIRTLCAAQSSDSLSLLFVEFELDYDIQEKAQEVRDKVAAVRGDLPRDIEPPVVDRVDPGRGADPRRDARRAGRDPHAQRVRRQALKPRLERVPGVGSVELVGDRAARDPHLDRPDPARRLRASPSTTC